MIRLMHIRRVCANRSIVFLVRLGLFALAATNVGAEPADSHSVAGWRGNGAGVFPQENPPIEWGDTKNLTWRVVVGSAFSSPIVVGNQVLLTAEPSKIVCVDLEQGKIRWRDSLKTDDLPPDFQPQSAASSTAATSCGFAAPTPVSDGSSVFCVFGSGLIGCHSTDGQRKWVRYVEPAAGTYGHSSSPLLFDDKLLVNLNHLVALDAASGKIVWECSEAKHTYGTPVRANVGGMQVVVTPLGDVVRVSDGRRLAKDIAPELGGSEYGISPAACDDVVYLGDRTLSAVRLFAEGNGIRTEKLWTVNLDVTAYASPVAWNGMLFFVGTAAECFVIDLKSGQILHEAELTIGHPGVEDPDLSTANLYPSLVVAGGKLFVGNDRGQTFVYEATKELRAISQNRLSDGSGATLAVVGTSLVIRSGNALCRIGK